MSIVSPLSKILFNVPEIMFLGSKSQNGGAGSVVTSQFNLGPQRADKYVVVCAMSGQDPASVTSMTVGGVSLSQGAFLQDATNTVYSFAIWGGLVDLGGNQTITVTWVSGSSANRPFGAFAVHGNPNLAFRQTTHGGNTNGTGTGTISVVSGDIMFGVGRNSSQVYPTMMRSTESPILENWATTPGNEVFSAWKIVQTNASFTSKIFASNNQTHMLTATYS